jgi:hypothetical protein
MQGTDLSNNTGVLRQGGARVTHTIPISYNSTGIATYIQVPGLSILASTSEPMQAEFAYQQVAAWGAATNVVASIGNSTTATEYLSATNTSAAAYAPASNAVAKARLVANTNIYVKLTVTGAAATSGTGNFLVTLYPENTQPIV